MSERGSVPDSSLASWLRDSCLKEAKENRQKTEQKWNRNRAARYADASLDPKGTWKTTEKTKPGQSDTFFDITKQKCVSAISLIADTVFKDNRVPFICALEDEGSSTEAIEQDPSAADTVEDAIEFCEARLHRQLRHCNAVEQLMKCLDDAVTYGEYWTHDYSDTIETQHYVDVGGGVFDQVVKAEDTKAFEHVTPWEMYRDMEEQDIRQGAYVIRARAISPYDLRLMVTLPLKIPANIKKVLEKCAASNAGTTTEYDNTTNMPPRLRDIANRNKTIDFAEFWCLAPVEKVRAFQRKLAALDKDGNADTAPEPADPDEPKLPGKLVKIFAQTANDEIVAFKVQPGPTPYEREEFEPNNDSPDGVGIADNMESCQKVLNGAIRSFEDNAKLIANFMLFIKREWFDEDPETNWFEGGVFTLTGEVGPDEDARKGMFQPQFADVTASLQNLITMFLEFSDMTSHVPRAEQGHQSANPQTAFELQQRLEKAGKYMGNVIKRLDRLIGRLLDKFHAYNMANPDVVDGKGDFSIRPNGFDSFQNRYIRLQRLLNFLSLISSDLDIKKQAKLRYLLGEIAKAQDMEPDQIWKTSAEMQAEAEAEQQSMQAQLELATLQVQLLQMQAKAAKDQADAERIAAEAQKVMAQIGEIQANIANAADKLTIERAKTVAEIEAVQHPPDAEVERSAAAVL